MNDSSLATRLRRTVVDRLKHRGARVAAAVVTVIVVVAVAGTAVVAADGGGSRYRTAAAEYATVTETLTLTGQIASAESVTAAFQVSGTVAEVLVALGDQVTAGQTLALLDTSDLQDAVTSAQDAVARAQQQLQDDLDAQSSGTSSSSPSSSGSSGGSSSQPSGSSGTDPAVVAAQQAVLAAQIALLDQYQAVTDAQGVATTALHTAEAVCEPFLNATLTTTPGGEASADDSQGAVDALIYRDHQAGGSGDGDGDGEDPDQGTDPGGTGGDEGHDDAADSEDGGDGTGEDAAALAATQELLAQCQDAILASLTAQQATTTDQAALTQRAAELDAAVTALNAAIAAAPTTRDGESTQSTPSMPTSGGSGSAKTITAEQILADKAEIDLAGSRLALAEQDLSLATLSSPIDGRVVAIALAAGDSLSASSTSAVVTVQGAGYVVEVPVPLAKIGKVAVGQTAEVVLPAFGKTYAGQVSAVGVLNVSQTSTPSYTVTLAVDTGGEAVLAGATAQSTIALSSGDAVLTVPTSAVTVTADGATVTVLRGSGQAETVAVEVGAVGADRTEIVSGLAEGDTVVIADLDKSISTEETDSATLTDLGGGATRGGRAGNFGGGGVNPGAGGFGG